MQLLQSMFNADADQASLAYSKMENVFSKSLEVLAKAPECLKFFQAFGQGTDATNVETKIFDTTGQANIVTNPSQLPVVGATKKTVMQHVYSVGAQFEFSRQELESSIRYGLDLDARKHAAAMRAHAKTLDTLFFAGDATNQITGLKDYQMDSVALAKKWTAADVDAAKIANDLRSLARKVAMNSGGVIRANRILLSSDAIDVVTTKHINGKTALDIFHAGNPDVEVMESYSMKSLAGIDAIAFDATSDVAGVWLPKFGERLAEQLVGLNVVVPVETRTAGLVVNDPSALVKLTNVI